MLTTRVAYSSIYHFSFHQFHFQNEGSTYLLNPRGRVLVVLVLVLVPTPPLALLLTPSYPSVSSGDLFDMALPMSIAEQRALLTSIAEIATLGRLVLSLPCKASKA